ncbi:hypothetical protein FKG96_12240 [Olivibacter sp. LS-1]|uniref:hypothetical protein n=1 Tax=Olivibacter sp. LS-1 TaxID=2592345 RepID=UPI0011EAB5E6|nr:hypothetical protein [Olivibacter sp. LS-1]QEL01542.1 hypothetical protein FKG96_12240 [Olivibacter sp. LS-1]
MRVSKATNECRTLVASLYELLLSLPAFDDARVPRIYLFLDIIPGRERIKYGRHGYVRRGFVEIGCLCMGEVNGIYDGVINVNIQDEDVIWIEELQHYLWDIIDDLYLNGFLFTRESNESFKVSRTLWLYNTRYIVKK